VALRSPALRDELRPRLEGLGAALARYLDIDEEGRARRNIERARLLATHYDDTLIDLGELCARPCTWCPDKKVVEAAEALQRTLPACPSRSMAAGRRPTATDHTSQWLGWVSAPMK
jgi:hypothetical protein